MDDVLKVRRRIAASILLMRMHHHDVVPSQKAAALRVCGRRKLVRGQALELLGPLDTRRLPLPCRQAPPNCTGTRTPGLGPCSPNNGGASRA